MTGKQLFLSTLLAVALLGIVFAARGMNDEKMDTRIEILPGTPATSKDGEAVQVYFQAREQPYSGPFTIIAIPDTQYYVEDGLETFTAQTRWIAENKDALNIVFVTHLGDITQNRDKFEVEWIRADESMRLLDGNVPYGMAPGDHDMSDGGIANFYRLYFPASRFEGFPYWGGSYNGNKENYQFFSAGGDDYIVVHLEYCPPNHALDWAKKVLDVFKNRRAIISTHAYLGLTRSKDFECSSISENQTENSNGVRIWSYVVRQHENVVMVVNGHSPGAARLTENVGDRVVHQMVSDYQHLPNGGSGYLRILQFDPANDQIHVSTYSPTLDSYLTDPENQFDLPYVMTGAPPLTGVVRVSDRQNFCTAPVEAGSCELVMASTGEKSLIATYEGDANYHPSFSEGFTHTVTE